MAAGAQRLEIDVADTDSRYHRQELISWWDQDRLSSARVLIVGAGALGNELLKNLALLGVGKVLIIDMDRIENSNLSRCVLFRQQDEGEFKAEVAARAARELNPDVQVAGLIADVRSDVGLGVFAAADLVLGGLDNREARLWINQSCWKIETPWIDGAIEGLMGTVRVFVPPDSACYECTMNAHDHELIAHRKSCSLLTREEMLEGKVPTTATSASVIAAMQAQEAVKLLHRDRIEPTLVGSGYAYNGLNHDSYVVTYARKDDCLSHDTYEPADSHAVPGDQTFAQMLEAAPLKEPSVDLEREIAFMFVCEACHTDERLLVPIERLTQRQALCPECGEERRLETFHSISATDAELLALRPSDLGLPRFDYITARSGADRRHLRLDGTLNAFDEMMRDG